MAKYMVLWKMDTSRSPEAPKVKKAQFRGFGDGVVKQMKEGRIKEWFTSFYISNGELTD